jgi:hypothetical protein
VTFSFISFSLSLSIPVWSISITAIPYLLPLTTSVISMCIHSSFCCKLSTDTTMSSYPVINAFAFFSFTWFLFNVTMHGF